MSPPPTRWGALILHPSRRSAAREAVAALEARLRRERPGYVVWTLRSPTEPVLAHARTAPTGARFSLVPLLLTPGAHYHEDVAELARAVRAAAPGLEVRVRPPLLQDEAFAQWLLDGL